MLKKIILNLLSPEKIFFIKNLKIYNFFKEKKLDILEIDKKRIWLLGTTGHSNIGDLAITEEEISFLRNYFKDYEIIDINEEEYFRIKNSLIKKISKQDIIFLHGGGNMGNDYPILELQRQDIIKNFKNNKVLVFPQTFHLKDKNKNEYIKKMNKAYSQQNVTVCLREERSYISFKESFPNAKIELIPDIVLRKKIDFQNYNRKDFLFCFRNDFEKIISEDLKEKLFQIVSEEKNKIDFTDMICDEEELRALSRTKIVENKFKQFSQYRLCITDRLHAIIFCSIVGTPCIAFNNHSRKVEGVYSKWLKDLKYIEVVNSLEEFEKKYVYFKENIIYNQQEYTLELEDYYKKMYLEIME